MAVLLTVPASAAEPPGDSLSLAPSSQWVMSYDDDSCRLARTFGEGDNRLAFYVERYEPGDSMSMVVAGKPLEGPERRNVAVQFGPNEQRAEISPGYGDLGDFKPALIMNSVYFASPDWQREDLSQRERQRARRNDAADDPPTDVFEQVLPPDREAAVEWLAIERKGNRGVVLELGSMGKPMEAMRACTDELLTHWGIDLKAHRDLTRAVAPKSSPIKWINSSDYPSDLLRKGAQGIVHFRLSVGADGRPTQCYIQKSTRPAGFDDLVCQAMMKKAQFVPALGKDGQPIPSYWRSTVRFEIPN